MGSKFSISSLLGIYSWCGAGTSTTVVYHLNPHPNKKEEVGILNKGYVNGLNKGDSHWLFLPVSEGVLVWDLGKKRFYYWGYGVVMSEITFLCTGLVLKGGNEIFKVESMFNGKICDIGCKGHKPYYMDLSVKLIMTAMATSMAIVDCDGNIVDLENLPVFVFSYKEGKVVKYILYDFENDIWMKPVKDGSANYLCFRWLAWEASSKKMQGELISVSGDVLVKEHFLQIFYVFWISDGFMDLSSLGKMEFYW